MFDYFTFSVQSDSGSESSDDIDNNNHSQLFRNSRT